MTWVMAWLMVCMISGCSDIPYYWQSAQGQWDITQGKHNIDELILQHEHAHPTKTDLTELKARPTLSQAQKLNTQLKLVRTVREFSVKQLHLPQTKSFTQYADLGRNYVVKNLFAATEFSTELYTWCYPVIGCASYRGYFDEDMLNEYKAELAQQGYDIHVANVSAYSTLGWFDDPVLNTFVYRPEYQLVGLLIHEIAHQQIYIDDDTNFNESFASAVEQAGIQQWFDMHGKPEQLQLYQKAQQDKRTIIRLITTIREDLKQLYQQKVSDNEKRSRKQKRLQLAIKQYDDLKATHHLGNHYDNWFAQGLNNAKLGSMSAYTIYVDAFLAMLSASDNRFPRFYAHVASLAELEKTQRHECLQAWSQRALDNQYPIDKHCRYSIRSNI